MKNFLAALLFTTSLAHATTMKLEGTCKGAVSDGPIEITYFSDFNGCKKSSHAAISFAGAWEGLLTGTRNLGKNDVYSFSNDRLILTNSTGNTHATLITRDPNGHLQTTLLECAVRDYEYLGC